MKKKGIEVSVDGIKSLAVLPSFEGKENTLRRFSENVIGGKVHHDIRPFHTSTGRDTIKGPSLTSISKKYWCWVIKPQEGFTYLLLDYESQEPAICAAFANDRALMSAYQDGDLYNYISKHMTGSRLSRSNVKSLVLPYLYGMGQATYAKDSDCSVAEAEGRYQDLDKIFIKVNRELDKRCTQSFSKRTVHSLDWQAKITPLSNPLSVRNWPVQAAGADIMRRACRGLYNAGIDLRMTIHDAFLIRVPIEFKGILTERAVNIIQQASAQVLDGFSLKVSVEAECSGIKND
jgi:DNA polymerase I-like protein with 3'-5' exonuclease and polymerase domains